MNGVRGLVSVCTYLEGITGNIIIVSSNGIGWSHLETLVNLLQGSKNQ